MLSIFILGLCKIAAISLLWFVFYYLPTRPVKRETCAEANARIRKAVDNCLH